MVVDIQVAKLMHDHILDAVDRDFHQVDVERDPACRAAASLAPAHKADDHVGLRNAVAGRNTVPFFRQAAQCLLIPLSDSSSVFLPELILLRRRRRSAPYALPLFLLGRLPSIPLVMPGHFSHSQSPDFHGDFRGDLPGGFHR